MISRRTPTVHTAQAPAQPPAEDQGRPPRTGRGRRLDALTAALAAALVAAAALIGWAVNGDDVLEVHAPPLSARWEPHMGPGTVAAVALAAAVVAYGPALAARLPWRRLLLAAWGVSTAWIWSLALVDGWERGVTGQLVAKNEYARASTVERFDDLGHALNTFTDFILKDAAPDNWPAHIAGHPPGAILTFVGLDRVGLGGGAWASAFCITAAGSAAVAVLLALRALTGEEWARRAAPFLVLAPWAVWAGVSADGYFAAVVAWALALLALAAARAVRYPVAAALGAGLLLGWALYLSYGFMLLAVPVAAVLWYARTLRPLPWVVLGVAGIATVFTAAAGFWWWEGYQLLHERYYQGYGGVRPYGYWVWANLATAVASAGLAAFAGSRRAVAGVPRTLRERTGPALMVAAAVVCITAADLSGLSKAETERIWLPFTLWLLPAAALLPQRDHRWWLAAQAVLALALNHLLRTSW